MKERIVRLPGHGIQLSNGRPLVLIAGPCVIEDEVSTLRCAARLKDAARKLRVPLVFKASYDKANRTSIRSFRGPGLAKGLAILAKVKERHGLPILTDVHGADEAAEAAKVADILQVPAFLCRQTDLLAACARTGLPVNVKKGQFLAPEDMENIVEKIRSAGNPGVILTERGASFGYHNLVVDMRALPVMKGTGCPVIFDATHSVQLPGGKGHATGGQREFILPLARAAAAVGVAGIFVEVHENPKKALSDGPNSLSLSELPGFLEQVLKIDKLVKSKDGGF